MSTNLIATELYKAIADGNVSKLLIILANKPPYEDVIDELCDDLLQFALNNIDNVEAKQAIVTLILENYGNEIEQNYKQGAISTAVSQGNFPLVKLLLDHFQNNEQDLYQEYFETAVMSAVWQSQSKMIKYFLKDCDTKLQQRVFIEVTKICNESLIKFLLQNGTIKNKTKLIALLETIQIGDFEKAAIIFREGQVDFNIDNGDELREEILSYAMENNSLVLLEALSSEQKTYDIMIKNNTISEMKNINQVINESAEKDYSHLIKLITQSANIELSIDDKLEALQIAAKHNYLNTLNALLNESTIKQHPDVASIIFNHIHFVTESEISTAIWDGLKNSFTELTAILIGKYGNKIESKDLQAMLQYAVKNNDNKTISSIIGEMYKKEALIFHNMIYNKTNNSEKTEFKHYTAAEKFAITDFIYSICGDYGNKYIMGKPVKLKDGTKINYYLYMPKERMPKAIMVEVYGGDQKGTRVFSPENEMNDLHAKLIEDDIAVVKLFLPDLQELQGEQALMPESLNNKIHECIHHFFNTIKYEPTTIHAKLKDLPPLRIILEGGSFGGALACMHATRFPNSFDGYISINGSLDDSKSDITRLSPKIITSKFAEYLNPSHDEYLNNLTEPLLIMLTNDDNNVHPKEGYSFVSKAKKLKKTDLINLYISDSGPNQSFNIETTHKKGHVCPSSAELFEAFYQTLSSFIMKGPHSFPALTYLQHYYHKKRANQFYAHATSQKKFISGALEIFDNHFHTIDQLENIEIWNKFYQPAVDAHFVVGKLFENRNNCNFNIQTEIERLTGLKTGCSLLTDNVLKNVLQHELFSYADFFESIHSVNPLSILSENELLDPLVVKLKELFNELASKNINICESRFTLRERGSIQKLLTQLYTSNPSILPPLCQFEDYKAVSCEYKQKLYKTILEEQRLKNEANIEQNTSLLFSEFERISFAARNKNADANVKKTSAKFC